eukprot:1114402_1
MTSITIRNVTPILLHHNFYPIWRNKSRVSKTKWRQPKRKESLILILYTRISDQCANSTLILMQEISLLKEQLNVISSTESQRNSNGKTKMIKDEKLHNKVFKMEDNFSAEILVIQSELKTIKQKQQQNTKWNVQDNPHAYAISTLKQKMSLLQQQIDDMTISESGDLQKDVMDQITTIRADIAEKYSILETKIEHLEQSDRGNVNSHSMDGAK